MKDKYHELIEIIYFCTTDNTHIVLSSEHTAYLWTPAHNALHTVTAPNINQDIAAYIGMNTKK